VAKLSDIGRLISQALKSNKILDAGGKAAVRAIPKRTRLGKGVRENLGQTHKLPALKTKTVKNRTRLKKTGKLTGKGATPKKSGLNSSGKMLDSLKYGVGRGTLEIKLEKDQERKATALTKVNNDFVFMNLSAAEFKRVLKAMTKQIEQALKKVKFTDL